MSHALNIHDGLGLIARDPGQGTLIAYGSTVPADATPGFAPGCHFIKTSTGGTEANVFYVNVGTLTSSNFAAVDLNIAEMALLSGLLATADEINRTADLSTRVVTVTAASLALTLASHSDKIVTINAAAGCAITLPAATGTGARFNLFIGTTITSNTSTITRAGSDTMFGRIYQLADGGATLAAYECPGSTIITLNGSTTGGLKGDYFLLEDVASGVWHIEGHTSATGSEATPVT